MTKKAREVIYRPDCNRRGEFPNYVRTGGFYIVTHGYYVVYAYFGSYYSVGEVISDVVARNEHDRNSLTGEWASMDFVVWHNSRIMAAVHQPMDDEDGILRVVRFDEEGNTGEYDQDSGTLRTYFGPFYGWPTHDEWVAAGRPDPIILTDEDMDRHRARDDAGKDIRQIPLDDIRTDLLDDQGGEDEAD